MSSDPLFPSGNPSENPTGTGHEPAAPNPFPTGTPGLEPSSYAAPGAPSTVTDSGLAPNVAAGLAVVLTLITGIIFLVLEKRNQFVRFWAMQAVFFGASTVVFSIVSRVLVHILGPLAILWVLFSFVVSLAFLAVWVVMLVKAFTGKEWEAPLIGKLVRQQLATPPKF